MRSGKTDRSELVAVVDLGSTAVRLLLARVTPNAGYQVLVQERAPTRLGGGARGTLPRAAIDETLRAVHRFFARYSSNGRGPRVVAIATSAVREARNHERLLDPLRRHQGIAVQVLSARDEARLGVSAALSSLPFTEGVVADLGGASLQLSRVRDRRIVSGASLPLGPVQATYRFLRHDPPMPRELQALRAEIRRELLNALPPPGGARSWWVLAAPSAPWPASTSVRTPPDASTATGSRCTIPITPSTPSPASCARPPWIPRCSPSR